MSGNLKKLKNQLSALEKHINLAKDTLSALEVEMNKSYEDVPGVEGTFDGQFMVDKDGKKYEVPPNYAAKSKLIYGMNLKMVEEDGRTLFKQIGKPETEDVHGILSKKEGKWYLLSGAGSYRISDTAAEFNGVKANDEAVAVIPKGKYSVPFAALKRVAKGVEGVGRNIGEKDEVKKVVSEAAKPVSSVSKSGGTKKGDKASTKTASKSVKSSSKTKPKSEPKPPKSKKPASKEKKETSSEESKDEGKQTTAAPLLEDDLR